MMNCQSEGSGSRKIELQERVKKAEIVEKGRNRKERQKIKGERELKTSWDDTLERTTDGDSWTTKLPLVGAECDVEGVGQAASHILTLRLVRVSALPSEKKTTPPA